MARTTIPTLYAISDYVAGVPPVGEADPSAEQYRVYWRHDNPAQKLKEYLAELNPDLETQRARLRVRGGYMERLPLACLKAGLVDYAEKWHYLYVPGERLFGLSQPLFGYRLFQVHNPDAPFHSPDMIEFIHASGAPHILCVWGLGVSEEMLLACRDSFKIYYSIDAPPLRVPPEVSRHFDLILVGAEWQRDEVRARHPGIPCELLTIGPEFADYETFRPLGIPKEYDLIYVAAAQPYKRHDILFDALARCSRRVRCLCIFGYGEMADDLRAKAREMRLDVDFIGPPGLSYEEVNYQMNRAKVGIVCGIHDGCPAIITEYMLAGLPVLANSELCCGLRFITLETGMTASPEEFHLGIESILDRSTEIHPRPATIQNYGWPASVQRLQEILRACGYHERE